MTRIQKKWIIVILISVIIALSTIVVEHGGSGLSLAAANYYVSGRVIRQDTGIGLEGVTISFGSDTAPVITNRYGEWFKGNLNGIVTIVPARPGWSFQPPVKQVDKTTTNIYFIAVPNPALTGPTNLTVTPSGQGWLGLKWNYPYHPEARFTIERKTGADSAFTTLVSNYPAREYNDDALNPGYVYYYRVKANYYGYESDYSNVARGISRPLAPANLTAQSEPSVSVILRWSVQPSNEQGYKIERKMGNGAYMELNPVSPLEQNSEWYHDQGLVPDTVYYYRIKAYNSCGSSDYSNEAMVATAGKPAAPSGLTARLETRKVVLSWADNSQNERLFVILKKEGASGSYYRLATVSQNSTSYHDTSPLMEGRSYYYVVSAYNDISGLYSDDSNEVLVNVPLGE